MENADGQNLGIDINVSDPEESEANEDEEVDTGYEVMRPNINKFQYKMMYDPEMEIVKV